MREASCILILAVACSAPPAAPRRAASDPPADPPERAAGPEVVLSGGHVGWIHALALSARGDRVAVLSVDRPDFGQMVHVPIPFATITVIDVPSGVTRAAWRVPAPHRSGEASARFDGDRTLLVDGWVARAVRLSDGLTRVFDFEAPARPLELTSALVRRPDALERRTARGKLLWSARVGPSWLLEDGATAPRVVAGSTALGIDAQGRKTSSVLDPYRRPVLARSADGRWSVERLEHRPALFEDGAPRAWLSAATSADDDTLVNEPAFAFAPDGRLWSCRTVSLAGEDARVRCWPLDRDGSALGALDVPVALGRDDRTWDPRLVIASSGHLVIAAGRSLSIVAPTGEVPHAQPDEGVEALVSEAMEGDDGSIALSSVAALGWLGPEAAGASLCPDLLDRAPRLRRVDGRPTAFAWRYVCPMGEHATRGELVHGVSPDGRARVVTEESELLGPARLRGSDGLTPLEGAEDACSFDGCVPPPRFSPDGRWLSLDLGLFDARTGRRVRTLSESETVDRDWRRTVRLVEREGALRAALLELASGEEVAAPALGGDDAFYRAEARVLVVREGDTRHVFELGDHDGAGEWWRLLPDAVATRRAGHLSVARLDDGATRVVPVPLGASVAVDPTRGRLAWCDVDTVWVWRPASSRPRELGPCVGHAVHVGERYVVTADGSRARVTRLDDGRGLRVRVVVQPGRGAWTIAEDDAGRFWLDPARMPHVRRRGPGPLLDAPVTEVTPHTEGYDPQLVPRFFAPRQDQSI